jgi:hypothetical protein
MCFNFGELNIVANNAKIRLPREKKPDIRYYAKMQKNAKVQVS